MIIIINRSIESLIFFFCPLSHSTPFCGWSLAMLPTTSAVLKVWNRDIIMRRIQWRCESIILQARSETTAYSHFLFLSLWRSIVLSIKQEFLLFLQTISLQPLLLDLFANLIYMLFLLLILFHNEIIQSFGMGIILFIGFVCDEVIHLDLICLVSRLHPIRIDVYLYLCTNL